MKRIGVVLAVLLLTVPVFAAGVVTVGDGPILRGSVAGNASRAAQLCYENLPYNGNLDATGWIQATSPTFVREVGDDLRMDSTAYASLTNPVLDSVSFVIFNGNNWTSPPEMPRKMLNAADLELNFYNIGVDPNGNDVFNLAGTITQLGADFTSEYPGGLTHGLFPRYYSIYTLSNLSSYNIALDQTIIASLKVSNMVGGCTIVGSIMTDMISQPRIGTSQDGFFLNGTWGYWFSGNPKADFGWRVGMVPEPASMILLGLVGLLIRRR